VAVVVVLAAVVVGAATVVLATVVVVLVVGAGVVVVGRVVVVEGFAGTWQAAARFRLASLRFCARTNAARCLGLRCERKYLARSFGICLRYAASALARAVCWARVQVEA